MAEISRTGPGGAGGGGRLGSGGGWRVVRMGSRQLTGRGTRSHGRRAQRGPLIFELMTGTAVYEIRRAQSRQELAAALELRHDVFCVEQGVPERDEMDGRDHEGIHLVAVRDGEMLATCRILLVGSTAQFSRLAVKMSARRQGIATALLAAADDESRAGGARRIVLHAQTYARELYELAGYRPRGRVFWEAGIEHIAMEKLLD
jgi:predicted GNAT family N-acyltransferase